MKRYTLSEYDIQVLIGVAANKVCDKRLSPFINDATIITIASEIASEIAGHLINHLSGVEPFPECVIEVSRECLKTCGIVPTEADEKSALNEAATSGHSGKSSIVF